ncbi:Ig-like domain-containing protein [Citrobacter amalonaticus]|uniref:Ig-like domain-containing protein n=1 Tax=Citrobacter amalonaticus TaxID=35703 RepID=UPI00255AC411|nr:Ig-like domain-containing protein [Citrobacter amalonaticus]MDL4616942.1 Ig-like domain-containing protein [Citrobacter amalonaticus]MDL4621040.1 Ig-like domain-containing protein [Citrobacter amalonaticus]
MQFFLPLMLAFTPAVRAAQAKWYQTPPEQQTVSVSASELPTLGGEPAADEKSGNGNDNATEARTAQLASKTGQFLNNASGDAAAGIARQMATGKASAEIEQWLNRVGTARVQMQLDEEFSLKNSSVDLLIPWYDSPEALVFSQHSLHRTDDRTQGNLGAGYRYYTPDWMAGVNAFYDYDFSGEHSRMGMGLEYGRDYLKLAANGYFRLSGWKNASDLADYEARPANGWDIRSEGYLPVYPQLGGKLVYEQYYGKEVGLFGRDNRQQDPRAVTAGLSYTPFPLMTLSADHRMGEGGENDTRLGVEFSWQFDTPLHKLLDTDAVGQMRTLAGSRYHLVDRNNNIVLEYREKNNLTLKMAEALRGYQGDRLSLDVVVNARHGLERIVWDDSTLRAAGGEVTCTANTQCVVTLPLWKTGGIDANTYVISAVAHDKAGNHSPQASTHIFVEQSAVNADNSTFEIVPTDDPNARAAVIEADGVTTATMTFRALDGQSLPISSLNPEILQHESSLGGLTISSVREVSAGVYVATVSGNTAGEAWMAPVVNGSALSSLRKPVTFVTSAISVNFIVVTDNAIADGVLPNSVKATLTDDEGNPLADKVVNFSVDNGATIAASGTTGPDGSVIMTLTSTVAGAATVTASINGNSESVNVTFTADAGSAHIADGALERVTNDALANGSATNSVKATVTDANGNPLSGQVVNFSAGNGATMVASGTTGDDGTVTMTLTSTVAGDSTVTASINGSSQSVSVTFVADASTARIADGALERVTNDALANGSATNSVKATVTDANGNPLSGQIVNFSAGNGATMVASGTTGDDGTVTMTLTSTVAGDSTVTASINGSSQSVSVTFTADTGTARITDGALERVTNDALANGSATNSVKATVTDAQGNLLSGQTVNFSAGNGATMVASGTTGPDGTVTMTLTSTVAGDSTVTASINGSSQSVSVTFTADTSTARIADGALERVTNDALANGSATNSVKATVTDANGNPLSGQVVNFSAGNGATMVASGTTGDDGTVTMTLTSTVAGDSTVTASINGSSQSVSVTFIADTSTARIADGALERVTNDALADGTTPNSVKATVTDANGNILIGQTVNFSAGNGASIAASGTTGNDGTVTMTLTSTVVGDSTVTASINNSSESVDVTFVADTGTAQIAAGALEIVETGARADGETTNSVKATVTDARGTPLPDQIVTFSADNGATIAASGTTGGNGTVTMMLTSRVAGDSTVTASINGSSQSVRVTFVADENSAQMSVTVNSTDAVPANGSATRTVTATLTDASSNPLRNQPVSFTVNGGPAFTGESSGTTGDDGTMTVTLTSTVAGTFTVSGTASGLSLSNSAEVAFIADTSTAQLIIRTSSDTKTANGTDTHPVTLRVEDAQGNPLTSVQSVTLSVPADGPLFSNSAATLSTSTDSNGELEVSLTSTVAGIFTVSASLGSGTPVTSQVRFAADTSTARLAVAAGSTEAAPANGTATRTVTATLTDAGGNPLPNQSVLFTASDGPVFSGESSGTTGDDGTMTVTLTSTMAGTFTVSGAAVSLSLNDSAEVTFIADTSTAQLIIVTSSDTKTANGTDTHPVTLRVEDAQGNPLTSVQSVTLSVPADGPLFSNNTATLSTSTDSNGELEVPLTSTVAGIFTVSASLGSGTPVTAQVRFAADTSTAQLTVAADSTEAASANGTATRTVTATLVDAGGNALPNQPVSFTVNGGPTFSGEASGTTGDDGTMTVTLTSTVAGTFTVSGTAARLSLNGSAQVMFAADASTARLVIETSSDTTVANGTDSHPVTLKVEDAQGNPLTSVHNVTLNVPANGPLFSNSAATLSTSTDSNGELEVPLTSTVAGTFTVSASLGDSAAVTAQVTFVADARTARLVIETSSDATTANGTDSHSVTLKVKDAQGNALNGVHAVSLDVPAAGPLFSNGGMSLSSNTESNGELEVPLTSTMAGTFTVSARLGNGTPVTAQVTFVADLSTARLIIETSADTRTATGTDPHPVTLKVVDAQNNALPGTHAITLSVPADGPLFSNSTATLSTSTESNGELEVPLTSTVVGTFAVSARLGSGAAVSADVTFVRYEVYTATISLSPETDGTDLHQEVSIAADGTAQTRVVVVIKDQDQRPATGLTGLKIKADQSLLKEVTGGVMTAGTEYDLVASSTDGVYYKTVVAGTDTGSVRFSITAGLTENDISITSNSVTVNLTAGEPSDAGVYLSSERDGTNLASTTSLAANGSDETRIVIVVKDANGHGVTGLEDRLRIKADTGGLLSTIAGTEIAAETAYGNISAGTVAGVYYLTVKAGTTLGTVKFRVTGGLSNNLIPPELNRVTVNLTAGVQSVAGVYLSSETDGTALERAKSLVADGNSRSYTRVVVTVRDANGHGIPGLTPQITALSGGGLLKNANGVSITEGTAFNMARGTADGVYYLSVWAQTTSGTVKFSVTGGLNDGVIPAGQNTVTVNLTAGDPSVAGIYLSSETDGTALAESQSLVANGSSYTRVVVKVEDANGNGVNDLSLKIAAQSGGGLLRNANNVSMAEGTDFDMVRGTADGVYYLSVWAGTTSGTVTFSVTDGLDAGVIPSGSNTVTVNLTAGAPSVAGIYLSSEANGTELERTASLVAVANSNHTKVVVTVKDANGNGVDGLQDLKIAAQSGGGLLTAGGVSMTQGTDFNLIAGGAKGVYYLNVWSGNTTGTVTFSVTGGLNPGVIPTGSNNVTVNLTAGAPSIAGIYLSSETDGTALAQTTSLVANGSSYTRVVVKVEDANGNGVNGLQNLKIAAQSGGGLLRNANGVSMTQGTDFNLVAGTGDGVYYLSVWSRTTTGTVRFSVTGGLDTGVIPTGNNNATVNLTAGTPSSANTSIRLSSNTDGTALVTSTSLVANGSNETKVVITVKDANGNPVKGLTGLRIKAGTSSLLKSTDGTLITTGTEYSLNSTTDGVYYKTVKAGTTAGSVRFWVSNGLPAGTITDNGVTVNLTAGAPSSANTSIRLSSRTDGTALVTSTSLLANGSDETKVVITVKDANGNPVKGLTGLRIKAGTSSLLKNTDGTLITAGTEYSLTSTTDGVYYKTVKAGTTAGSVRFWVSAGLPGGAITDNGVTVTLTVPPPASAQVNAWWSYQGGSNGSTYRTFRSAVRFLNSAGTPMQCDSVTVVGNGDGYSANANTTMANRHTFGAYYWNNDSSTFNTSTKVYSFSKSVSVGKNGGAGNTYDVVLAASGQTTYPVVGWGFLGGRDILTVSCKVGSTTYSFKTSNGMTVNGSLGI